MLISRTHRFIFIHIYKNAGSSVTSALLPHVSTGWRRLAIRGFRRLGLRMVYPQPFPDHITAGDLRAQLGPATFDSYFSFAIVRNPWDWQVSLYQFALKNWRHHQHELIEKLGSFDEYLRWRCDREVRLQKDFICDPEGQLFVDFVGRFEQIDRDFGVVCSRIGVDASLPRINVSNSRPYQDFYTEKTAEMVRRAFEEDILEFGYEF